MPKYAITLGAERHRFDTLAGVMAAATPLRSGDMLAGLAAESAVQRVAVQMILADLPRETFLSELLIPYETDEVTRLIIDTHDAQAFAAVAQMTVGQFRDWLLSEAADSAVLAKIAPGITPEMAAAVSKIMRNRDLIAVTRKIEVTTAFRNTLGLPGCMGSRLQPNHPADDLAGIAASTIDGLLYGVGDAVIGVNPATDNSETAIRILDMLESRVRERRALL